jgi:thiol-disulfide isomerase/thioredoxin
MSLDFSLNEISLRSGFEKFYPILIKVDPKIINRKYLYITIWNIACKPCEEEIPYLESFAGKFKTKMAFIMVSHHTNKAVWNFIHEKSIIHENFLFINEMNDFISGVFNQLKIRQLFYPLHIILDREGNILAYAPGAFFNDKAACPIIKFILNLPE